jgi:hypothetical protein
MMHAGAPVKCKGRFVLSSIHTTPPAGFCQVCLKVDALQHVVACSRTQTHSQYSTALLQC